ncbi:MAG: hypothetical protein CMH54_07960 [Myxococcales bacterium]|nr:hypothetical protein [Myxococcales bacterium]|tara:strand:- start:3592 stop:4284 length:693 start_codon:yes stop_codon:yes gene_type:complete
MDNCTRFRITILTILIPLILCWSSTVLAQVNINKASAAELQQLPGIGPKKASLVVEYRDSNGAFRTVDELIRVKGIGPKTLERIRPLAIVGDGQTVKKASSTKSASTSSGTLNVNTASASQLVQLKGVGPTLAKRIVANREMHGPFFRVEDMRRVKGIGEKSVQRIRGATMFTLNVNDASQDEFSAFGFTNAANIIAWRKKNGAFKSPEALLKVPDTDSKFLKRVRPILK